MNQQFTYFLILGASLAGPLLLSFDKKVAFYKSWKFLFPAMIFPALFYIIWDCWFTSKGVWSFNPEKIVQSYLYNLPIEEVLFFFIVPYCCVFIYECIRCYFPGMKDSKGAASLFKLMGICFLIAAVFVFGKDYTFYTLLFNGIFIFLFFLFRKQFPFFHITRFLISYLIILIPFLVVNGFLTAIPVVLYNDAENLAVRIHTIPVEDVFYGMLLIMMNIAGFEWLRNRSVKAA